MITSLLLLSSFFASAVKPILYTMVFDILPSEKRKIGSSLLYLGINLGVAIGPLLAGFLFNHYLNIFFIVDSVTSFIAVGLVLINIKENMEKDKRVYEETHNSSSFVNDLRKRPDMIIFFVVYMLYNFVYIQNSFSLPLMLKNIFMERGTMYYGYTMSINALTVVFVTMLVTYKTRKNTSLLNIAIGGIFYAIGFGIIGFSKIFILYLISTMLWTVGEILEATNSGVYVANKSDETMRARYSALLNIMNSAGRALGVFTMGGYIDKFGVNSVWSLIIDIAFLASTSMYLLNRYNIKKMNKVEKNFVNY